MVGTVQISRQYVNTCEKFWRDAPVQWDHKVVNNSRSLHTVADAKRYIDQMANIWKIRGRPGADEFINTLHLNAEYIGAAAQEYIDGKYQIGGQNGTATYIYVVISNESNQIVVTFTYHHLVESLTGNSVYTSYAKDITIDWLNWKA
ncbi:unnamed protein product, partial [Rotaria socialis]